jgi:hypothetical protein
MNRRQLVLSAALIVLLAMDYLVLTIALGSVGPLFYLIRRFADRTERLASVTPHSVSN